MESVFDNILSYFEEKELKDLKDSSVSQEEKIKVLKAYLGDWLVKASKEISNSMMSTHPCTFVHPSSAKNKVWDNSNKKPKTIEKITTPIIAENKFSCDGYVRSGNVYEIKYDVFGNAAYMRSYKFLYVKLNDGLTVFQHIEMDTPDAHEILSLATDKSYEEIRNDFLNVKKKADEYCTSNKIRQIFFPIGNNDYHLLSIFMPSGIMSKLNEKTNNNIPFNRDLKDELNDLKKNHKYSDYVFITNPDLTIVEFGGSNFSNISYLCAESSGEFNFLPSLPPALYEDKIKTPAKSFFKECLRYKYYSTEFKEWQKLLKAESNNKIIRVGRDKIIQYIFDDILRRCFVVRTAEKGWSNQARCAELPEYEKILLDNYYAEKRNEAEDELQEFIKNSVRWIMKGYSYINKSQSIPMFDDEFKAYMKIMKEQAEVLLC